MSSRRSSSRSRQSGSSRISDDQISDLISKHQHLIPELRRRRSDKNYGYSDFSNRVGVDKESKRRLRIKNQKRMLWIFRPARNYNSSEYSTRPLYFLFVLIMMAFLNNVTCAISNGPPPMVFLNFRGDELRYNFVSHVIDAFERYGINVFVDKYEQRGKDLKNLFVRINDSRIALAIFSTRYTESSWCMDELVKMKQLADQGKLQVIPIFYKVEAEHVREQEGEFGENFWTLAKKSSGDQIKKWKEALECISDKMGLSLGDKSSEADFVKEIVTEVKRVIAAIRHEERKNNEVNYCRTKKREAGNCNCLCELPNFKRSKTKKFLPIF